MSRLIVILTEKIFHGYMNKNTIKSFIILICILLLTGYLSAASPMETAYQHVLSHWQPAEQGNARRGYNIAAVLISPDGKVLAKELNTVIASQDCTQHAEMRLIQNYLAKHRCFNLRGYTVYTTLEPCAMCTATMAMTGITNVYYGQSDPAFGKAAERLARDTSQENGYKPYPRGIRCTQVPSPLQAELETSFRKSGIREITKWLATDKAKSIFSKHLPHSK